MSHLSKHCVKSVRIRSYPGPFFPAFGLNTERYYASLRIQSECGKMRTTITPNMNFFYVVKIAESDREMNTDQNYICIIIIAY